MEIFGYSINKKPIESEIDSKIKSFAEPDNNDGAIKAGGTYTIGYDLDPKFKNSEELIKKYREMASNADVDIALDEIVNDAIVFEQNTKPVEIDLSDTELSDSIKNKVKDEFETVLKLLKFNQQGDELFRQWFVDGKLFFHAMVDPNKVSEGIVEMRKLHPDHITKVSDATKKKNPKTGVEEVSEIKSYYVYNDPASKLSGQNKALKIDKQAIVYNHSGLLDEGGKGVISRLHSIIRPFNQLVALEDSVVVYRITRAPERRVFYIDVSNLPKKRAEQYMNSVISNHKNKTAYDSKSGSVKDNVHIKSMVEDIFIPRKNGSNATEIDTLPSATNLGEMDDVLYFNKKLYRALKIPASRMETETAFSLGGSNEITRDEIKFGKYIAKLRKKFANVFSEALKRQLVYRNIMTVEEVAELLSNVQYIFSSDSHFTEMKNAEIMSARLESLSTISDYIGTYFSTKYVKKNILMMTDDEIKEMDEEIKEDESNGVGVAEEDA